MAKSRLIGDYPVIGIRPTIDGRRGALKVRELLEEQTMNMAKSAAKLFTENLRYSNGESVKVVIADTTIGRVAEAAACADKFRKEGVDITLTVTPCWCYGAETMDTDLNTIKAVWGFNGSPFLCITYPRKRSSVLPFGAHSLWIRRAPITVPAPHTVPASERTEADGRL